MLTSDYGVRSLPFLGLLLVAQACTGDVDQLDPGNSLNPDISLDPDADPTAPVDPGPELVDGRLAARIWRLTDEQFLEEMKVLFGENTPDLGTLGTGVPSHGFTNGAFGLQIDQVSAANVFNVTRAYAEHVASNANSIVECTGETPGTRSCAEAFLQRLSEKAYRRPVTNDEFAGLMELYDLGAQLSYEKGVETSVHGLLNAPDFLYRTEIGRGSDIKVLDEYEIATLLSFVLTGRSPDSELLAAAAAERLTDPAERTAQAQRLLSRSDSVWRTFGREWLDMPRLEANGGELAQDMREESERFVMETVLREEGSFDALFTSSQGWLSAELAEHYGVNAGAQDQAVELGPQRTGILSRAAWLTSHARSTDTSLELRGHFVWSSMLCNVIPEPPAGAIAMQGELAGPDATKLEIVEARKGTSCNGCHQYMDPIGFGFETYDEKGVYRDADDDGPIDPAGTVPDFGEFADAAELSALIAGSEMGRACFAERLSQFLLGAQLGKPDQSAWLNQAYEDFMADRRNIEALVLGLVAHPAFIERGAQP